MAVVGPLILRLARLPEDVWEHRGCYPNPTGTNLPARMRFLHPDAAVSLAELEATYPGWLHFSDIYRHPFVSLGAIKRDRSGKMRRPGAQPPGYSGHGWGLCVDLHLKRCLERTQLPELRHRLADFGWYGHRRDEQMGAEAWHFNFLGPRASVHLALARDGHPLSWSHPLEARIQELYGPQLVVEKDALRARLVAAEMHQPDFREAVTAFQAKWGLVPDGVAGPRTQRTMALVSATYQISEMV